MRSKVKYMLVYYMCTCFVTWWTASREEPAVFYLTQGGRRSIFCLTAPVCHARIKLGRVMPLLGNIYHGAPVLWGMSPRKQVW